MTGEAFDFEAREAEFTEVTMIKPPSDERLLLDGVITLEEYLKRVDEEAKTIATAEMERAIAKANPAKTRTSFLGKLSLK